MRVSVRVDIDGPLRGREVCRCVKVEGESQRLIEWAEVRERRQVDLLDRHGCGCSLLFTHSTSQQHIHPAVHHLGMHSNRWNSDGGSFSEAAADVSIPRIPTCCDECWWWGCVRGSEYTGGYTDGLVHYRYTGLLLCYFQLPSSSSSASIFCNDTIAVAGTNIESSIYPSHLHMTASHSPSSISPSTAHSPVLSFPSLPSVPVIRFSPFHWRSAGVVRWCPTGPPVPPPV